MCLEDYLPLKALLETATGSYELTLFKPTLVKSLLSERQR
jgi:hypothetical protein